MSATLLRRRCCCGGVVGSCGQGCPDGSSDCAAEEIVPFYRYLILDCDGQSITDSTGRPYLACHPQELVDTQDIFKPGLQKCPRVPQGAQPLTDAELADLGAVRFLNSIDSCCPRSRSYSPTSTSTYGPSSITVSLPTLQNPFAGSYSRGNTGPCYLFSEVSGESISGTFDLPYGQSGYLYEGPTEQRSYGRWKMQPETNSSSQRDCVAVPFSPRTQTEHTEVRAILNWGTTNDGQCGVRITVSAVRRGGFYGVPNGSFFLSDGGVDFVPVSPGACYPMTFTLPFSTGKWTAEPYLESGACCDPPIPDSAPDLIRVTDQQDSWGSATVTLNP